jgi:hypothetical protein
MSDSETEIPAPKRRKTRTASKPPEARPPTYLSHTHVTKTMFLHKKLKEKLYVRVVGNRVIGSCCTTCTRAVEVDLEEFAPHESHVNNRRRPRFLESLAALREEVAKETRDETIVRRLVRQLVETRHANCQHCQETMHNLSPAKQACKDFWEELRRRMCAQQDGCMHPACQERGMGAVHVLQGDHINPETKVNALSRYTWWSRHGGVAAMKREAGWWVDDSGVWHTRNLQWPCGFCHALEPTTRASNRYTKNDVEDDGKEDGRIVDEGQYNRHLKACVRYPKQRYNDKLKRRVGACADCGRKVTRKNVWAFEWDHRDPRTKVMDPHPLLEKGCKRGGVANIVANCAKRSKLRSIVQHEGIEGTVGAWIKHETQKCDLVCANCHKRRTFNYPAFCA